MKIRNASGIVCLIQRASTLLPLGQASPEEVAFDRLPVKLVLSEHSDFSVVL